MLVIIHQIVIIMNVIMNIIHKIHESRRRKNQRTPKSLRWTLSVWQVLGSWKDGRNEWKRRRRRNDDPSNHPSKSSVTFQCVGSSNEMSACQHWRKIGTKLLRHKEDIKSQQIFLWDMSFSCANYCFRIIGWIDKNMKLPHIIIIIIIIIITTFFNKDKYEIICTHALHNRIFHWERLQASAKEN